MWLPAKVSQSHTSLVLQSTLEIEIGGTYAGQQGEYGDQRACRSHLYVNDVQIARLDCPTVRHRQWVQQPLASAYEDLQCAQRSSWIWEKEELQ